MEPLTCTIHTHTASDGYAWHYRHYQPAQPRQPRALVVYLHGIQSHGGWYETSCRHLAGAGFDVYFPDRRGSGLNQQARGDTPSFRRLLDDVTEFIDSLKQENAAAKIHLLAVSWGGKLAVGLQRWRPGLVDDLALLCPGFFARLRPPFRQRLRIFLSRWISPGRLFPIPLNDPELFTATPHWQQFLRDDPLSLHQATARFLVENTRLSLYLKLAPKHVRVPTLLMLAEHDRIIDNARTRLFVQKFATDQCQILEYPGTHHTLEFEPNPEVFLKDLQQWLERGGEHATSGPAC